MENISKWRIDSKLFWFQVRKNADGLFNARYWPARTECCKIDCFSTILSYECFQLEAPRFTEFAALDHARRDAESYVRHGWKPPHSEIGNWA